MAWTEPHTYVPDELAGVDVDMNEDVKENLEWLYNPPRSRIRHAANQDIGDGADVTLSLTTVVFDYDDMTTTASRLTAKTPGHYLAGGCVQFDSNATGIRKAAIGFSTGTVIVGAHEIPQTDNLNQVNLVPAWKGKMSIVGSRLSLHAEQHSGGTLAVETSGVMAPVLWAAWLGE